MLTEDWEKVRQEVEAIKLALVTSDPVQYVPIFYPELIPQVPANIAQLVDQLDLEGTSPEIEYDLVPPPPEEAAAIIEKLLADRTGQVSL